MKNFIFGAMICLLLFSLWSGCSNSDNGTGSDSGTTAASRVVVTAQSDPGMASVNSAVWSAVTGYTVSVGTNNTYNANVLFRTDLTLTMKAITVGDTVLYIRAQWKDATPDVTFGQLHARWINASVEWEVSDTTILNNEDHLYLAFEKSGANRADCSQYCHSTASSAGRMFYGGATDQVDIWNWKSTRTGLAGFAEDMHLTDTMVAPDPQVLPNDNLYFLNYYLDPQNIPVPVKMDTSGADFTGDALLEGQWVSYDPGEAWITFPPGQEPVGKFLPGYYFYDQERADGSRWDVTTISENDGQNWTVVFRRKISTGDTGDRAFSISAGDSIQMSAAIADNSGEKHHGTAPFYLVFQ